MLKLISLSFFILWSFGSQLSEDTVKKDITLCHDVLPSSMAEFMSDPEFIKIHPSPLAFDFNGIGQDIKLNAADGKDIGAYFVKSKIESNQWLFVFQEWWGLNDNIRNESDKYFSDLGDRINILALDMYDGKITANPSEAGKLMQETDKERLETIMKGGLSYAGKDAKIASVGWCFGGGLSLKSALLNGQQNVGSVMYYGMPVDDVAQLKTLNSDVLGLFATEKWISQEVIENFATNMEKAGKKLTYKIFDAVHGFANPSNPKHDPEAAKTAYRMSLDYLKAKFNV
ncbi:MAG: carboxymethylenebutenolidase [Psychromonas sp.]|jgi:carboxymethylenebutenolidase